MLSPGTEMPTDCGHNDIFSKPGGHLIVADPDYRVADLPCPACALQLRNLPADGSLGSASA